MAKEREMENNQIGSAIQYFRESFPISQSKLCRGLCSIATLSRIEAGARDVDTLLLETLLERLGKVPNNFELILTDSDYELYQSREEIKKQINDKNYAKAVDLLEAYERVAASKGSVHMQFVVNSKALLNEMNGGAGEATIELLMEAIAYTVPDFKTNDLNDYYLSNSELSIIIDAVQRMISVGMTERAKVLLIQILKYLDTHVTTEDNLLLYPKVAVIAARFFLQEGDYDRAVEMCDKGLEKNKGSRKMDYLGDLTYLKAQTSEKKLIAQNKWYLSRQECEELYLQAYYMLEFCGENAQAEAIKKYLQEVYQWEDID